MNMQCRLMLGWLVFALACAGRADNYYVANVGNDAWAGTNWATAVATISNAVKKAAINGDIVFVSNGTYMLTAEIVVANGITVRSWNDGGFDPTGTIVDGNAATRCLRLTHADAAVAGLTIRNGTNALAGGGVFIVGGGTVSNCIVTGNSAAEGGGIYITNGGLITACTVRENMAITNAAGLSRGGGIFVWRNGVISNSVIINNTVNSRYNQPTSFLYSGGGGIGVHVVHALNQCRIYDSLISNNVSEWYAGGINAYQAMAGITQIVISGSTVANNQTYRDGGGVYFVYGVASAIGMVTGCLIEGNAVTGFMGISSMATGSVGGVGSTYNAVEVHNCLIRRNTAVNGGGGVNLRIFDSIIETNTAHGRAGGLLLNTLSAYSHVVSNCIVRGNRAEGTAPSGIGRAGGINAYFGGGANAYIMNCAIYDNYVQSSGGGMFAEVGNYNLPMDCWIYNSLIYNNVSAEGGGLRIGATGYVVSASTIVSNIATTGNGGGVMLVSGFLTNCIVYSNSGLAASSDIYFGVGRTNNVFYCCMPTNVTPWQGNIMSEPRFVDFGGQDFRLAADSPCIDAGTNEVWMDDALDLGGYPRIDRLRRRVDIGAYEHISQGMLFFGR